MRVLKPSRLRLTALASVAVVPLVLLAGCGTAVEPSAQAQQTVRPQRALAVTAKTAGFDEDGDLMLQENHHEWIFVGAPVTPNDMNDGQAAFPEFHNVYIDPASFAAYKETGTFPNGTVILKELVSIGGKSMPSGRGYFQGEFKSLEAMVKDTERYRDEPGGWAFFRFGEAPNYNPVATRMKTAACNSCHSGATEDDVFTATYPVLRAAKAKLAVK